MQRVLADSCVVPAVILLLAGCSSSPEAADTKTADRTGPVTIYTVNYPLQYFAQRIGGRHVGVVFPAPQQLDPTEWQPNPAIIADYQNADLILLNGDSDTPWTQSVSLPPSKLVDTTAAFRDQLIAGTQRFTHSHGPGGEHVHAAAAGATWLDPRLAILQAAAIHEKLRALRPQHAADFDQGFESLEQELLAVDTRIEELVAQRPELPLIFSHPVYPYFAQRYQLNSQSVHWEPNEMPGEAMWEELASLLERHPAAWMIWEAEPDEAIAARLRDMGVASVLLAPCGNRPANGDYFVVMRANLEHLASVFGEQP